MSYDLTTRKSWAETRAEFRETFRKWGINDWNIIANLTPTRAGNYYQREDERSVTLRYTSRGGQDVRLTMAKQARAVDNLRVLWLAVEAMRLNEARGIGEVLREAYAQLPAPANYCDPYEVLGVRPDADMADIDAVYRSRARRAHSDTGGSDEEMKELNAAMERIREDRKAKA